jgi:hypothetical protein
MYPPINSIHIMYSKNFHMVSTYIMTVFQKIGQDHLFGNNHRYLVNIHPQSWIRTRIWRWRFRIRLKGPDPTGSRIWIPNSVHLLWSEHTFEAKKGGCKKIGIQSKGWELLRPWVCLIALQPEVIEIWKGYINKFLVRPNKCAKFH